jgi:hypothetical protein
MTSQKIVILAWTHKVSNLTTDNVNNFWGIGDLIRGTIQLYQLSKKHNFELIVDIQHHPISSLLKERTHKYSDFVREQKDNIPFIFPYQVENHILNNLNALDEPLSFITTDYYHDPITEDCQSFIKDILTPNNDFQTYMREKDKPNPFFLYSILHYRVGDAEMVRGEFSPSNSHKYMQNIIKNDLKTNENIIFLSDSQHLKNVVKQNGTFFTFDTEIGHTGYHKEVNKLRDALFEFFTMTKATKIKSYTINNWPSGFVNIAHIIYNVPLDSNTCLNERY